MTTRLFSCLAFAMLTTGPAFSLAEQQAAPAEMTFVTTSAHCDWTWGHSRAWHEDRYAQIIHDVLMIMRENPRYVWQLENENEQLAPFLKKAAKEWPGMIDEFWRRVRQGRIEVIVAIANPRLSEVYPETLVRNLVLGKQYFRRHAPGIEQKVFNAVDVMSGCSQIPQILSLADYRYFMFSRPCAKKVAFWRTGLDGTRMLSVCQHYSYEGPAVKGVRWKSVSGDDILPSAKLAQEALTWDPKQKVLTTSVRYLEELERRGGPDQHLEGVLDSLECPCEAILHGNRNLYTLNNQNEDLLLSVEKAQLMASAAGASLARPDMDQAWHDLLSCTGHAILYCWKPDYEERLEKARQTRANGQRALQEALAALTRSIRFRSELGSPIVVLNSHGWPVSGPVEVGLKGSPGARLLRDATGREIPLQSIPDSQNSDRWGFVAEAVPACGYKTFYLSRRRDDLVYGEGTACLSPIENEHFRIEMQPDGALKVFDKARGTELGSPKQGGLGDIVLYDAPQPKTWELNGPLGPRHAWQAQPKEFRSRQGQVYSAIVAKGTFGPHKVTREVRLWGGSRRIDYLVEIDAAEGNGVFAIRFPTGLSGRVFAGIPFGAEPREHFEREPFRGEYFVQGYPDNYYATRWTDNSTADFGYTFVCPQGMHSGYMHKATEQAIEFMLLRVRPQPTGGWSQVHPSLQGTGRHTWRCSLVPHAKTWREAATYRDAMECHVPLAEFHGDINPSPVAATPGAALRQTSLLNDSHSFLEVTPANVMLSSLRLVEPTAADQKRAGSQKPEWEIRLYETTGTAGQVVLRLDRPVARVRETNFLGEPAHELGKIETAGKEIRFAIRPWKIATLRVSPAE